MAGVPLNHEIEALKTNPWKSMPEYVELARLSISVIMNEAAKTNIAISRDCTIFTAFLIVVAVELFE